MRASTAMALTRPGGLRRARIATLSRPPRALGNTGVKASPFAAGLTSSSTRVQAPHRGRALEPHPLPHHGTQVEVADLRPDGDRSLRSDQGGFDGRVPADPDGRSLA